MKLKVLIVLLVFAFNNMSASVLTGNDAKSIHKQATEVRLAENGSVLFIRFDESSFISANGSKEFMHQLLKLSSADELKLIRSDKDELGFAHDRYQQFHNNIKVENAEYIVHAKLGRIVSINGEVNSNIQLSSQGNVQEAQALNKALGNINAERYKWQMPEEEALLRKMFHDDKATYFPKGELVYASSDESAKTKTIHLAWKFDIYADAPLSRDYVYIDANTGEVMKKVSRLCFANANATGNTKYSGTQSFVTDSVNATTFRLRETGRANGVETYNLVNGTNYGAAVDFTDSDNVWTSTANQDNAALDAHWGAEKTFDYYFNIHGRNSYDNLGSKMLSYVHYSSNYNNAFWDGVRMTYGDGSGTTFSALTQLDVCGHEFTHGVTGNSSNLVYSYQSGALNESFSDIFGTAIEFYSVPAVANWLLGDLCYTPATPGDALRSLSNPNAQGDPDTYLGTYWYTGTGDNGGVHTNSGVQNFWFYLLSQGGTGTNDVGFNYNVSGIGINQARMIAYRNNNFYLTSGSQYVDAGYYSVQAATDLYGPCSPQALATKNAWDAVNVNGFSTAFNVTVTASASPACEGSSVTLSTAQSGSSFSWTGPNGFSSTLANPVVSNVSAASAGTYTCSMTTSGGCQGSGSKIINVNAAPSLSVSPSTTICSGANTNLLATASAGGGVSTYSNTSRYFIPDNNVTGVQSPITVSGATGASSLVRIKIDSLSHTYTGDLQVKLIAPDGSVITLASQVGGGGDNFIGTEFNATSTNVIGSTGYNTAPFTGIYKPLQAFSLFTGSANGVWKLHVIDVASVDTGSIWKWTLQIVPNVITNYSWSPSGTLNASNISNPVATPTSLTTYSVTVTDLIGCTKSSTTTIGISNPAAFSVDNNVSCFGGNNGSVNLSVSGGVAPYSFSWSNGATTEDISNLTSGNYSVTVTDNIGCVRNYNTSISQPSVLSASTSTVNASCGGNNGSASASVNGGTAPYTYAWNNGATTSSISNVSFGTYNVTVTDSKGCTTSASAVINNNAGPSLSTNSSDATCGNNNGTATASVSGGTAPYTYAWNNGGTTQTITGLAPANYTVTVTDANNCSVSLPVTVNAAGGPSATASSTNSTCGNNNGSASSSVIGGTAPFTYLWNNGATTPSISNVSFGIYNVTVTDFNGCTATASATINNTGGPSLSLTTTDAFCGNNNGTATANVSGGTAPFTYQWNTGGTTQTITSLSAGNYSVVVTDANNCSSSLPVTVNATAGPTVSISTSSTLCGQSNGSATANVSGGTSPFTYLWSTGATTQAISNLAAGNYSVAVTDANGCNTGAISTVSSSGSANTTFSASATSVCAGASVTLTNTTAGSGLTYQWKRNNVNVSGATNSTYTFAPSGVANYSLSVTGSCGTITSANQSITANSLPTTAQATATSSGNTTLCSGSNTTLSVPSTAGFNYQWQLNSVNVSGATNSSYTVSAAGSYRCFVYNSFGCSRVSNVIAITVVSNITASITSSGPTTICSGATVTLSASPTGSGYGYQWKQNGSDISGQTNATYAASSSGNYTCSITIGSCSSTSNSITVTSGAALVPVLNTSFANICNNNPVSLSTTNYGAGYSYQWKLNSVNVSGATNLSYSTNVAGSYSVDVSNGACSGSSASATLVSGSAPVATFTSSATTVCAGVAVNMSASPTGSGYSYQWLRSGVVVSGATNATYSFAAGSSVPYTVTVWNNCGSSTAAAQNITVNPIPTASIAAGGPTTFCAGGNVVFTATSNIAGSLYQWQRNSANISGATNATLTATTAGSYRCIVNSPAGCTRVTNAISVVINCRLALASTSTDVQLYPNPSNEAVTIEWNALKADKTLIEIISSTGVVVSKTEMETGEGRNNVQIETAHLVPAIYFVRINNADGIVVKTLSVIR